MGGDSTPIPVAVGIGHREEMSCGQGGPLHSQKASPPNPPYQRVSLSVVGLVLAAALLPASTRAAVFLHLSTRPKMPRATCSASVLLQTYAPSVGPFAVPASYPWRVEAIGPRGALIDIKVRRTRRASIWRGRAVFPSAGRWLIRVTNFAPRYDPRAGATRRVIVRSRIR